MPLPSRSLQKLLRDHVPGQPPLTLNSEQATNLTETLISRVEHLSGVKRNPDCFQHRHYLRSGKPDDPLPETFCCCLLLQEANESRWASSETHLHLLHYPKDQQLKVKLSYEGSQPISGINEVVALIDAFRERVAKQKAQATKRKMQQDLKVQAIIAQVRKIAKEDHFDFATEVDKVKLKLIIRLSDDDYFAILIPFNKFKEVLPKLRTAIQSLRDTYNSGVRFKTHLSGSYHHSNWVRYQDLIDT